jgi:hypothetical protein
MKGLSNQMSINNALVEKHYNLLRAQAAAAAALTQHSSKQVIVQQRWLLRNPRLVCGFIKAQFPAKVPTAGSGAQHARQTTGQMLARPAPAPQSQYCAGIATRRRSAPLYRLTPDSGKAAGRLDSQFGAHPSTGVRPE